LISRTSTLEIKRVPITQIYLGSAYSKQSQETVSFFVSALEGGWDLTPVHLVVGDGVTPGMYRLEDGRKRLCAHIITAEPHILAVVEHRKSS